MTDIRKLTATGPWATRPQRAWRLLPEPGSRRRVAQPPGGDLPLMAALRARDGATACSVSKALVLALPRLRISFPISTTIGSSAARPAQVSHSRGVSWTVSIPARSVGSCVARNSSAAVTRLTPLPSGSAVADRWSDRGD